MGDCAKDEAFHNGSFFIDTANFYQAGESEQCIGEWMQARGNRDPLVLATKYTATYAPNIPSRATQPATPSSLRNLQTD
ncbi:uncharacterized protein ACHE_40691A [Aspergillus chevalieri]|uniref:NADP-dependent oxidoreductase domain-containing protein n=1 Tax=Aspergillus chevalieri TaxID=182096 RepID=A0A7R7ZPA2_ASPCH|nr:uncharacterized protein ACHE_40691A [Aspergillus chevalieri]BCR88127.1 hypothetical protein ACHE_40691A [Aspergillus chevalieri]